MAPARKAYAPGAALATEAEVCDLPGGEERAKKKRCEWVFPLVFPLQIAQTGHFFKKQTRQDGFCLKIGHCNSNDPVSTRS